jgi:anti-sigma regulatory factor (Ser/Thr protein kinase)
LPNVCRVAQQHLEDQPVAAAKARSFVASTLRRWELPAMIPDAQLAVTELVTNAILHARTPIVVTVCVAEGTVEVAVTDYDPRAPRLLPPREDLLADLDALKARGDDHADPQADPRAIGLHYGPSGSVAAGRGLIILEAITSAWGVTPHPDGKDVWARLPVTPTWPYLEACSCSPEAELSTASGRPLQHIAGGWDEA